MCSTGDARTPSVAWSAAEARAWLERAAASPTAEGAAAACELADLLLAGAPPDVPAALKLLEAAMDRGSAAAAPALARVLGTHPRVRLRLRLRCTLDGPAGVRAAGQGRSGGEGARRFRWGWAMRRPSGRVGWVRTVVCRCSRLRRGPRG